MGEVVFTAHQAGLMVVVYEPRAAAKDYEYRIQIGDVSDLDSFVPRHEFGLLDIPILTRLLNLAYPAILQHMRTS